MHPLKIFFIISALAVFAFPFNIHACLQGAVEQNGICLGVSVSTTNLGCPEGAKVDESGICINGDIDKLVQDKDHCLDANNKAVPGAFCSTPFCCPNIPDETGNLNTKEGACVFKCNDKGQCENLPSQVVQVAVDTGCMNCKEIKTGSLALPAPGGHEYIYFSGTSNKSESPVLYTLVGQNTCEKNGMTPFVVNSVNAPQPPVVCSPFPYGSATSPDTTTSAWKTYTKCATLAKTSGLVFSNSTCNPGLAAFLGIDGGILKDFPNENCQDPKSQFPDSKSCFCVMKDYGCRRVVKAKDCFCSVWIPGYGDECSAGNPNCGGCPYDPDCDSTPWPEQCYPMLPVDGGIANSNGDGGFHDPNYPGSETGIVTPPATDGSTVPPKTCAQSGGATCETPSQCSGYIIPASDTKYCCGSDGVCTAKHYECNDQQKCVEVSGTGKNACSVDTDCAKPLVKNMKVSQECDSSGMILVNFGWDYEGEVDESRFDIQVDDSSSFSSPEVARTQCDSDSTVNKEQVLAGMKAPWQQSPFSHSYCNGKYIYTTFDSLIYSTTYYWRVKVYDSNGNDSGWVYGGTVDAPKKAPGDSFTTPSANYCRDNCPDSECPICVPMMPEKDPSVDKMQVSEECMVPPSMGWTKLNFSWDFLRGFYCGDYFRLNWKTSEIKYDFQIDDDSGFSSPEVYRTKCFSPSDYGPYTQGPGYFYSDQFGEPNEEYVGAQPSRRKINHNYCDGSVRYTYDTLSNGTVYYWRVKVYDNDGKESDWWYGGTVTTREKQVPFRTLPADYCGDTSCTDDSDCPSGQCVNGYCPLPCDSNSDCPLGECDNGYCASPDQQPRVIQVESDNQSDDTDNADDNKLLSEGPLTSGTFKENYCDGYIHFGWVYVDNANNYESRFQFQVDDNADFSSLEVNNNFTGLSNPSGTINSQAVTVSMSPALGQIAFNARYYWRVKVYNNKGFDSGWVNGVPFTTANHAYPSPSFSFSPASPLINQAVQFIDSSKCYTADSPSSYDCKTDSNTTYLWTLDDGSVSRVQNPFRIFGSARTYREKLKVCDKDSYCCSTSKDLRVRSPLSVPEWKEISPF